MRKLLYLASSVAAFACTGVITDVKEEDEPGSHSSGPASPTAPSWTTAFPRLTHQQYDATVTDLLYLTQPSKLAASFVSDGEGGLFGNQTSSSTVGETLAKDYENAAKALAATILSDTQAYAKLVPVSVTTSAAFVERFLPRCYRRPINELEQSAYVKVFEQCPNEIATGASEPFAAGVSCVIQACLQDPSFLYRVEDGLPPTEGISQLTPYEIASRLSFLLWNRMPSDALFEQAANGALDDAEGVEAIAREMVEDERALDVLVDFHTRWLELPGVETLSLSADAFPAFAPGIGVELREETERFVNSTIAAGGTYRDLLTSRHAELTEASAKVYGVPSSATELPAAERGGVFTRAAFLARFSDGDNTAPILRGRWFKDRILCKTLKPPKDGVPEIGLPEGETTMRKFVENGTSCGATCHQVLNPPGFALEQYNALGVFRTEESNGLPIDPVVSYLLDGEAQAIDGGVELSEKVADSAEAQTCYALHWIQFVLGRAHGSGDHPFAESIAKQSLPIAEVLPLLVTTPAFLTRVASEPE